MATYDGILIPSMADDYPAGFLANALADWSLPPSRDLITTPDDSSAALVGTWNDLFPLEMPENLWTGLLVPCYLTDYYLRFWLYPESFSEFIMTDMIRTFVIWNAWLAHCTCTEVEITESDQLSLELGSSEPPFVIRQLRIRTFTLDIPAEGAVQFTSIITFDFGIYGSPYVTFTGLRMVVFGWLPLVGMQERLEWVTDIIRARDGSEQRMSVRPAPRQYFKLTVYLDNEEDQTRLDMITWKHQKLVWGLPLWAEWTLHTDMINIDDTIIYLDTTGAEYRNDSMAIIWQGPYSFEVIRIDTVESDRLNLVDGVINAWMGDKYIMPLRVAIMQGNITRPATPDGYGSMQCDFMVRNNVVITGFVAEATYNDRPVLVAGSIVEKEQELQQDADVQITDYGFGLFEIQSDSDYNIVTIPHVFRRNDKNACWDLRQLFHYLVGRRGTVYVPTYKQDMMLATTLGSSSVAMIVENRGFALNAGLNTMRKHLAFVFPNGTELYREIINAEEIDADTETITLSSSLGIQIEPGDCEICFLDLCRLAADDITFDWESASHLKCEVSFVRVQQ